MRDCFAAGTWRSCVKIPLDGPGYTLSLVGSGRVVTIQYDTTRDVILTCAQKLARVTVIYCIEPKTRQ